MTQDRPVGRDRAASPLQPGRFSDHDPVTAPATPEAPVTAAAAALPPGRGPVPTVQLNTRISVDTAALLSAEALRTGRSKRELVERALHTVYELHATPATR